MEKYAKSPIVHRPEASAEPDFDLSGWFSVSGDMDDFIYYGEPEWQESER